jgi:hypothetical protein
MRHPHLADACLAEPGQSRQQLVASHGADSGRGSMAGIAGWVTGFPRTPARSVIWKTLAGAV